MQAKLSSMVGTSSGYLESLPKPVRNRIAFLDLLQGRHDTIEENYQKEKAALEAKYRAMYGADITEHALHVMVVSRGTGRSQAACWGMRVWKEKAYTTSGKRGPGVPGRYALLAVPAVVLTGQTLCRGTAAMLDIGPHNVFNVSLQAMLQAAGLPLCS